MNNRFLFQLKAANCVFFAAVLLLQTPQLYAQPANDDCTGAVLITPSTNNNCIGITGTTTAATPSPVVTNCALDPLTSMDVWYSFAATHTSQIVRISNITATNSNAVEYSCTVAGFSGNCGALSEIGCSGGSNGSDMNLSLSGLTVGTTYYIEVLGDGFYDSNSDPVTSDLNFTVCALPPPANDDCASALNLDGGGMLSSYNYGASQSIAPGSCAFGTSTNDVWFKVSAVANGTLTVTQTFNTAGGTAPQMVLEVMSGNCGALTEVQCVDNGFGSSTNTVNFTVTAGTTYYLRSYGTFDGGAGAFSIQASGTPLPVSMDLLSGKMGADGYATLYWRTLRERNCKGFEIQRAIDGNHFTVIGFVPSEAAEGNSNAELHYSFKDKNLIAEDAYYLLRQTDKNGSEAVSNIVRLNSKDKRLISCKVAPNPVLSELQLLFDGPIGANAVVRVTNLLGKTVIQANVSNPDMKLDLSKLAGGMYLLNYSDGISSFTVKVNKK